MSESQFTWREELAVSFPQIDREHQDLVRRAAELQAAIAAQRPVSELRPMLSGLVEATERHFTSEEGFMLASGYPHYERHRAEHARLLQQLGILQNDLAAGFATATQALAQLVRSLTEQHILYSDKPMAAFLKEHGIAG